MNKIQLDLDLQPGTIVAVLIDGRIFESTIKFRSIDPQTKEVKYYLHGLKGMSFTKTDFLEEFYNLFTCEGGYILP